MEGDNETTFEQRFNAAVKVIQSLPSNGSFQPSNDMMLKFYSYYKQATQGLCNIPRPGFWDPVGKAKWDAWNSLGDMAKEEAMAAYVDDLKLILESMPVTNEVEELLQVIGPFYELVDEKKISQVSDLSTARLEKFARQLEGFGCMLTSPPKSVTKSIIRTMQMNGTLDVYSVKTSEPPQTKTKELHGRGDHHEEEKDEEVKKGKMEVSAGRSKGLVSNGSTQQHKILANGTLSSQSNVKEEESEEESESINHNGDVIEFNGHTKDGASFQHVASDSDSEVYCDSVDQFGAEEGSEVHVFHSSEETHSLPSSTEEVSSQGRLSDNLLETEEGVQHSGEHCRSIQGASQKPGHPADRSDNSVVRRGRDGPQQDSGRDGERWGTDGLVMENLNEQIICALTRLQDDMQSVLERLHTLEALTTSQAQSLALPSNYLSPPANNTKKKSSWWPIDVSPGTVALAVIWPFVVQWLIRLYVQRRRRKYN